MELKLTDWINKTMPLFTGGLLKEATGRVVEGDVKMSFHEWEIRIDLTPNESLGRKIQDNY